MDRIVVRSSDVLLLVGLYMLSWVESTIHIKGPFSSPLTAKAVSSYEGILESSSHVMGCIFDARCRPK